MCVSGGGEEKTKALGTWVVGKKKKTRNKKEKRNGEWGLRLWQEKGGSGKGKRKKKLKGKKLNWFYLYVHFVWYKVQNCENLFRGCL